MTAVTSLRAQISVFTYQGRLDLNGAPVNGRYDFMFRLTTLVRLLRAALTLIALCDEAW